MMRGEDHPMSKLTEAMVIDARCYAQEGVLTTAEIIKRLGISRTLVREIERRRQYGDVPD